MLCLKDIDYRELYDTLDAAYAWLKDATKEGSKNNETCLTIGGSLAVSWTNLGYQRQVTWEWI